MGSDFSKQLCCVTCRACKEAKEEAGESKPILQTSRETSMCIDSHPCTPALETFKQGEVQPLSQDQESSVDAVEENMETCSAVLPVNITEGWETAWDSSDFLVAPVEGQTKREVEVLIHFDNQHERERVGNTEEKTEPVVHASEAQPVALAAQDVKLLVDQEQPDEQAEAGREGYPRAGINLQEKSILDIIKIANAACQGCETKPPVDTGVSILGSNVPLSALQIAEETESYLSAEHTEETDGVVLPGISPPSTEKAELVPLVEAVSLLTMKATEELDQLEAIVNGMAGTYSASAMPWESLEPTNQLHDFLQQEIQCSGPNAQESESLHRAEPAELSKVLCQSGNGDGGLGELEDGKSRECDAETVASEMEPQHEVMQQRVDLPEEPLTSVQMPIKQEAEFLAVAPSLSEVLGSSGEKI